MAEADADLFQRRPYVLTSHDAELEQWIRRIGARVVILPPEEHDRLVALTSHLATVDRYGTGLVDRAAAGCRTRGRASIHRHDTARDESV